MQESFYPLIPFVKNPGLLEKLENSFKYETCRKIGKIDGLTINFKDETKIVSLVYAHFNKTDFDISGQDFMFAFADFGDNKYLSISLSTFTDLDGIDAGFNKLNINTSYIYEGILVTDVSLSARKIDDLYSSQFTYDLEKCSFKHSCLLNPETDILEISKKNHYCYHDDSDYYSD